MKKLIAVVDDEEDLRELLSLHLGRAGFDVEKFADAAGFYAFLETRRPDLVVLDLMLPDADGMEICKILKRNAETARIPVVMLTARGEEIDRVLGLELGADDYVTKPFSIKEFTARIHAVLRRGATAEETRTISVGRILSMDLEKYEVKVEGRPVDLTSTEFKILQLLASRKGRVFTREQILDFLWGDEKAVVDRTVDVHIRNLREKLGPAAALIRNIRGVGYKVEE
jgi:DNA-binding response OmpR family regulator